MNEFKPQELANTARACATVNQVDEMLFAGAAFLAVFSTRRLHLGAGFVVMPQAQGQPYTEQAQADKLR